MSGLFRRKIITAAAAAEHQLARTLSWPHLVALGVGAIVGTGILTLIGVGADRAGPAVLLSFVVAGAICACAALCYAEMATMIPASGSAYTYSYAVLGEMIAWVVGWSLILEYSLVVSTVAVGWSGYAVGFLHGLGVDLPERTDARAGAAGGAFGINLPAVSSSRVVAGLLMLGTRESARINTGAGACSRSSTLALFVAVALPHFDAANLHPFAPYGYGSTAGAGGVKYGVMGAAAIIFFAFYGFDAISTAAEEAKNPERDLAIGIVGSMVACTVIYMVVAAAAVGALHFAVFANSPEPLALILREIGQGGVATIVAAAAAIALPTVILGFLYGQSRIFLVMARDGFLPPAWPRCRRAARRRGSRAVTAVFVSDHRRADAARRDRQPRQCRDAVRVHRGGGVRAGAAAARPGRARDRSARRWPGWSRPAAILGCLYLFTSLQSDDADVVPGLERDRAGDLFPLRPARAR